MTPSEVTNILRQLNAWLRAPSHIWREGPTTKEVITAIDAAVEMIASLEAKQQVHTFDILVASVSLKPGERYAGIVRGNDNEPSYRLILLPGDAKSVTHDGALKWAEEVSGELPNRREQAFLYANYKSEFAEAWYWSSALHESDPGNAWCQSFYDGRQVTGNRISELRARAVRREYF